MTKSRLFKKAHQMTRVLIQNGDDYRITFGQCIKFILKNEKRYSASDSIKEDVREVLDNAIEMAEKSDSFLLKMSCKEIENHAEKAFRTNEAFIASRELNACKVWFEKMISLNK